jgi:hypothetical protein
MSGLCEIGTTVGNEKFLEPKYEIAINICIFFPTLHVYAFYNMCFCIDKSETYLTDHIIFRNHSWVEIFRLTENATYYVQFV